MPDLADHGVLAGEARSFEGGQSVESAHGQRRIGVRWVDRSLIPPPSPIDRSNTRRAARRAGEEEEPSAA